MSEPIEPCGNYDAEGRCELPRGHEEPCDLTHVCGACGHAEDAHHYEPGFYDVRGHRAECVVVSCDCRTFRPARARLTKEGTPDE